MSLRLLQKQFGLESEVSAESKAAVQPNRARGRGRGGGGGRGGDRGGGGDGASKSGSSAGAGQFGAAQSAGPSRVLAPEVRGGFHGSDAMKAHIAATKQGAASEAKSQKDKAQEWKAASEVAVQSGLGLRALEEKKQREEDERQARREAARARKKGEVSKKEAEDARAIEECEEQALEDSDSNERVKYEAALIVRIANRFGSAGVWTKIAEARSRGAEIPLDARKVYLLAHPDKCPLQEAADATAILNAQRPPEMSESRTAAAGSGGGAGSKEAVAARLAARRAGGGAALSAAGGAADPQARRIDPEDGEALSFEDLVAKYQGTYSEEELKEYWDTECTPAPAAAAAPALSPREEERQRRIAARAARASGGAAAKPAAAPKPAAAAAAPTPKSAPPKDEEALQDAMDALADAAGGDDADLLRSCLRRAEEAGVDQDALDEARERLAELCADEAAGEAAGETAADDPASEVAPAAVAATSKQAAAEEDEDDEDKARQAAEEALADAAGGEDIDLLRGCIRKAEAAGVGRDALEEARERLAELREAQEAAEEVGNDALNEARHAQAGFADDFAEVANFNRAGPPRGSRAAQRPEDPEPAPKPAPKPVAKPKAEPKAKAKAKPKAEPKAEPKAKAQAKAKAAATPQQDDDKERLEAEDALADAAGGEDAEVLRSCLARAEAAGVDPEALEEARERLAELAVEQEPPAERGGDDGTGVQTPQGAVPGLARWLACMGLSSHVAAVAAWAKEQGAVALEELAECAEDLTSDLGLDAAEGARLAAEGAAAVQKAKQPRPAPAAKAAAAERPSQPKAAAPAAAEFAPPARAAAQPQRKAEAPPAAGAAPSGPSRPAAASSGRPAPGAAQQAKAPAAARPPPGLPAPEPSENEDERRIDPDSGEARTLRELHRIYAGQYNPGEIDEYWASCAAAPAAGAPGAKAAPPAKVAAPASKAPAAKAPASPAPPAPAAAESARAAERRIDPETGEAKTLAEMRVAYAGQYGAKEIEEYWESCAPTSGSPQAGGGPAPSTSTAASWGLQGSGKKSRW